MDGPSVEMPKYESHKQVWALKIKSIVLTATGATITPVEAGYGPFPVTEAYLERHEPKGGGYFVVYKDGYRSFSPALAFEEVYTPVK